VEEWEAGGAGAGGEAGARAGVGRSTTTTTTTVKKIIRNEKVIAKILKRHWIMKEWKFANLPAYFMMIF
jgi:hypothetical protein